MEIETRTLTVCALPQFYTDSAVSDAALSPPPELPDIARVLYVAGRSRLFSAEPAHGCILCDGNVVYTVCYMSVDGTVEAWSSAAAFRSTLPAAGVTPDTIVTAETRVDETTFTQGGPRDVYIRSEIEIRAAAVANEQVSCIGGDGLIVKTRSYAVGGVKEHKSAKLTVTEDVRLDSAAAVVMASGYAAARDAVIDGDAAVVSGEVHIRCVLKTSAAQPLTVRTFTLPFSQLLTFDGLDVEDMARVQVTADEISAAVGEDGTTLALTAVLTVRAVISGRREISAVCDAYSTESIVEVTRRELAAVGDAWAAVIKAQVHVYTDMSGGGEVTVLAEPSILWSRTGTDEISVEGILAVRAIYLNGDELVCRAAEIPFTATLEAAGVRPDSQVIVGCFASEVTGELSGGRLSVAAQLDFPMQIFTRCDMQLATEVTETGEKPARRRGLYVCFVREGETLFDVAKRYMTTQERIQRLNPDAGERLTAGQKLIVHT